MAEVLFQFDSFDASDPNALADQIELYLFVNAGSEELSREDAVRLIGVEGEAASGEIPEGIEPGSEVLNVKSDEIMDGLFQTLESRVLRFSDLYPFIIEDGVLVKKTTILPLHNVYVFCVACCNLTFIVGYHRNMHKLTSAFEALAAKALDSMLPEFSVIRIFGVGSDDRRNHFGTDLKDAIKTLAADCCCTLDETALSKENGSGDCGLDVVGVASFPDKQRGALVFFCQCATGKNWQDKCFEPNQILTYINCCPKPIMLVSIPYDYREADGAWINYRNLDSLMLIDRTRLLFLLQRLELPELPTLLYSEV
jgi:hypothetical protein